jgi:hypothetical protein
VSPSSEDVDDLTIRTTLLGIRNGVVPYDQEVVCDESNPFRVVTNLPILKTTLTAPGAVSNERRTIGIGEWVEIACGDGEKSVLLSQGGTVQELNKIDDKYYFQAGQVPEQIQVDIAYFDGHSYNFRYQVITPSSLHYVYRQGSDVPIPAGRLGCRYNVFVILMPDIVSFANLALRECPTTLDNPPIVHGTYFTQLKIMGFDLDHHPISDFRVGEVDESNAVQGRDDIGYQPGGNWPETPMDSNSSTLTWNIPHEYRIRNINPRQKKGEGVEGPARDLGIQAVQDFTVGPGPGPDSWEMAVGKRGENRIVRSRDTYSGRYR